MTTNTAVRTAWQTNVFNHINNGGNSYSYEIIPDSEANIVKGYYANRIDFWVYVVTSTEYPAMTGMNKETFTVKVKHWVEQKDNISGSSFNQLIDDFRTVNDYVLDNLGASWGSTIQVYTGPTPLTPSLVDFGQAKTWFGEVSFEGINFVNS